MGAVQIRSGNVWLASAGSVGEVRWTTRWPGGCHELSFRIDLPANEAPEFMRPGKIVSAWKAGQRVFRGIMQVPERGPEGWECTARGLYRLADDYYAMTAGGVATSIPDTAVDAAIGNGLTWTRSESFSNTAVVSSDDVEGLISLGDLLDMWADEEGERWAVNANGELYHAADPTAPDWVLTPGTAVLGASDSDYASHVRGRYRRSSDLSYQTVTASDAVAAATFGRKEVLVDLTTRGPITTTRAQAIVDKVLSKGRPRLGWANDLKVTPVDLRTPGGCPADLALVRAGQMLRIFGATDPTGVERLKVDVVIGQTTYTDGAGSILLAPLDQETTYLSDAIERATGRSA